MKIDTLDSDTYINSHILNTIGMKMKIAKPAKSLVLYSLDFNLDWLYSVVKEKKKELHPGTIKHRISKVSSIKYF